MLFNSVAFFWFFLIVTAGYFVMPSRWRWAWLLAASCYFYMQFIPLYILILLITIVIDYWAGMKIAESEDRAKRMWLVFSVVSTCAVLFVFKYYNFFIGNLNGLASFLGWNYSIGLLEIILPIGLSFHTFQSLSYVIEIYRGHQKPERHFGIYSLYVMFYPQLVAGPIERPQNLLHQLREHHAFDVARVTDGVRLIMWGLFKKMVIADRLAIFADQVFNHPSEYAGWPVAVATLFFAFQIYCDFSGYSDIARGTARVMGFELMLNFDRPYFSRSISEFWRRWHMSLSTWFKDYLYISLGGNRGSAVRTSLNLFITFVISGFWHGANWTYVVWGALNGFYLIMGRLLATPRSVLFRASGLEAFPRTLGGLRLATTFLLICLTWIFFRAADVGQAWMLLSSLLSEARWPEGGLGTTGASFVLSGALIGFLLFCEFFQKRRGETAWISMLAGPWRWGLYFFLVTAILFLKVDRHQQFIYFQF